MCFSTFIYSHSDIVISVASCSDFNEFLFLLVTSFLLVTTIQSSLVAADVISLRICELPLGCL